VHVLVAVHEPQLAREALVATDAAECVVSRRRSLSRAAMLCDSTVTNNTWRAQLVAQSLGSNDEQRLHSITSGDPMHVNDGGQRAAARTELRTSVSDRHVRSVRSHCVTVRRSRSACTVHHITRV
jgi:precorrin-6B methylase 1